MSREIFALLLIVLLLAGSLLNISRAERLCTGILENLDLAEKSVEEKDWPGAKAAAEAALKLWQESRSYTHIFIRHSEIDSFSDAYFELKEAILSESEEIEPLFDKLRYHIENIADMEKIRLGNIF